MMVWGGVSSDARTELDIVEGHLNASRYIERIFQEYVVPYVDFIGAENFLLMHDNARAHSARCVDQYLSEVDIRRLNWPARSPDMNPIKHV